MSDHTELASEEDPMQPDYRSQEQEEQMETGVNAGTGRRLTEEESREKTKDWPKEGDNFFKASNHSNPEENIPEGFDNEGNITLSHRVRLEDNQEE